MLLFCAAIAVFVIGRGGTMVLTAVVLGFGAVAVLLLSTRDALPDEDLSDPEPPPQPSEPVPTAPRPEPPA